MKLIRTRAYPGLIHSRLYPVLTQVNLVSKVTPLYRNGGRAANIRPLAASQTVSLKN
jgi:hypothetical protein